MKKITIILLLLMIVISCDKQSTKVIEEENQEIQLTELSGTKWYLNGVYDEDNTYISAKELFKNEKFAEDIMLYFYSEKDILVTLCNIIGGDYTLDGDSIKINPGRSTGTGGCFNEMYNILDNSTSFKATENILRLNSNFEGYSGLEFQRAIEEPVEIDIVGTKWKLSKAKEKNGSIIPLDNIFNDNKQENKEYAISFLSSTEFMGNAGCHNFIGFYNSFGNVIELIRTQSEESQCEFPKKYLELLSYLKSYSVTKDKLKIYPVMGYFYKYEYIEFDRVK